MGVEVAEGGYTESAYTQVDGLSEKVDLKALSAAGLNEPRVIEGRLPRDVHEVAVTQKYLDASGKKIGDTVTFESAEEKHGGTAEEGSDAAGSTDATAIFERGRYTITASVFDPMDVNAGSKTMSFRSTGGPQYAFFLTPAAVVDRDTFTSPTFVLPTPPSSCPTRMNTRSSSMASRDVSSRFASAARRSARAA